MALFRPQWQGYYKSPPIWIPTAPAVSNTNGTLSATLGALTASSAGTVRVAGSLNATLGTLTSSAAGTVSVSGVLTKTLGTLTLSSPGSVAITGVATRTLGAVTVAGAGLVGGPVTGSLSSTLGSLTLVATGIDPNAVTTSTNAGGWGFYNQWELERTRRKKRKKELEELEAERERIEDAQTREIARFLQEQEAKDTRREELQRLSRLVASYQAAKASSDVSDRVQKAITKAAERQTTWALLALERELKRQNEEEEFILEALRIALDD